MNEIFLWGCLVGTIIGFAIGLLVGRYIKRSAIRHYIKEGCPDTDTANIVHVKQRPIEPILSEEDREFIKQYYEGNPQFKPRDLNI
jgi:hypothetical protein